MMSCFFIIAFSLHAVTSFPTEHGAHFSYANHVSQKDIIAPEGGFSKIVIRDYSIDNNQTSDFFKAAVTGVIRETLLLDYDKHTIQVVVNAIESSSDADENVIVEYSLQLNETLLTCTQTTTLMNTSITLFENAFGNEAFVLSCGHENGGLSLNHIYAITAGGIALCVSVIFALAVIAKKKFSGPKRDYFYIQTQLYDRVLELVEDEQYSLNSTKAPFWCKLSPKEEKKFARVLVCDKATAVDANQEYQKMKGSDYQMWYCDMEGCVRSKVANLALEIKDTDIIAASYDPANQGQMWHFSGDHIVNDFTDNLVVDIRHAIDKNGAELCAYRKHGGINQKWTREFI